MVAFRPHSADTERLDFKLLAHGSVTLYLDRTILDGDTDWLSRHGYRIYSFACDQWLDEDAMHDDLARTLGFPGYYGNNLNAFIDSMGDFIVPDEGGCALRFLRFDVFVRKDRETAQALLDIVENQSRYRLLFGTRLITLVQSDDYEISLEPVGARGIIRRVFM